MYNNKITSNRNKSDKIFDENIFMNTFLRNFLKLLFSKGLQISITSKNDTSLLRQTINEFLMSPSINGAESINEFCRKVFNAVIRHGDSLVYSTVRIDEYTGEEKIKLNMVSAKNIVTPPDNKDIKHAKDGSIVSRKDLLIKEGYVFKNGVIDGYIVKSESLDEYVFWPKKVANLFSATTLKSPIDASSPFDTRPGPSITPSLSTLIDVTKLINAEVKAQTLKAKIPAVLEILDTIDDVAAEKAKENLESLLSEISTNDVNVLVSEQGTTLKPLDLKSRSESDIKSFIEPLLRYVSSIFGVSYDALTNDISNASGATARAVYAQAFADTDIWRNYLYNELLNPVVYLIIDYLGLDAKDYEWQFSVKPFGYIRAKEEFDANKLAIDSKQKTRYEVITEQGYNPEEMVEQDRMLLTLERKYNPYAGIDMTILDNIIVNFNTSKYTYAQAKKMLESLGLTAEDYIGEKNGN